METQSGQEKLISKVFNIETSELHLKDLQSIIKILAEKEVKRVLNLELRRRLLPQNILDMPINHLDLSIRARNCLKRTDKYEKVSDLLNIYKTLKTVELLKLRGFGRRCLQELENKLYQLEILNTGEEDEK